MIVSCPACNTAFNADPALLAPDGRKVRCARCAHVWRVGADGMPAPVAPAPETEPPAGEAEMPGAAETPQEEGAAEPPEGGLVMSARELLEREEPGAGPAVPAPETAEGAGEAAEKGEEQAAAEGGAEAAAEETAGKSVLLSAEDSKEETGAAGQSAQQAALANLAAKRKEQRGKRQKGGRKFRIFLLALLVIVIVLLAVAYFTGRFGPGGAGLGQKTPAVSDVPPSPRDAGEAEAKPAEGGHIIGSKE
jgi:predicted Zn finger-like uncharacterized protein